MDMFLLLNRRTYHESQQFYRSTLFAYLVYLCTRYIVSDQLIDDPDVLSPLLLSNQ